MTHRTSNARNWVASQYLDDGRWGVLTEDNGIVVSVRSKEGQLSENDARLIAAAPELLAVCKDIANRPELLCECGKPECATTKLRAVISKAECRV